MIDINKKYRTRDGQEVRIYATDSGGIYPIHGAWSLEIDSWENESWTADGKYNAVELEEHDLDLIEGKPRIKQTVYLNIYNGYTSISSTEKVAEDRADCGILARVKVDIDVEEGHGL